MERYEHSLRWLTAGGVECIRMIGIVIRDRAWRTMPPLPGSVVLRRRAGGLSLEGRTPLGAGRIDWQLRVAPRDDGLEIEATLKATGNLVTNRSGLVVLLPTARYAGAKFVVSHRAGGISRGTLPREIAPHQPLLDVAGVRISPREGPALGLAFEGEVFEMEDQRNWLDPTFKLYSRALARPFPYRIRDGSEIRHALRIGLYGDGRPLRDPPPAVRKGTVPRLGVALPESASGPAPATLALLQSMRPAFVHYRARGSGKGIARARSLAQALKADLHLECFGERLTLVAAATEAQPRTLALHGVPPAAREAMLRTIRPAEVVGGTYADFVMLNRHRESGEATRVAFSLCPTVHARDDRSLIESLGSLDEVFAQASRLAGTRAIDAGPASLRRRLQPASGKPATHPRSPSGAPYDVDPRQGQPIAAAWLACAIAIAARRRLATFCAFEAWGARGLVGSAESFPLPEGLAPGERSPAFAVMAALCARSGEPLAVHAWDAFVGAAFSVGSADPELWLVELAGRRRPLPQGLGERVIELVSGPRGKPSRRAREDDRTVPAYGIARCRAQGLPAGRIAKFAAAWCRRP